MKISKIEKHKVLVVISILSILLAGIILFMAMDTFQDKAKLTTETENIPTVSMEEPELLDNTDDNIEVINPVSIPEQDPETPKVTIVSDYVSYLELVPLDSDVQQTVFDLCSKYSINPDIIFAQIYVESSYRADVIGDNGNSFGLMQIQPRWNKARMEKLGVTDLLDPVQNVTVGIDILAEHIERYDGAIEKALVAYNQGSYRGVVTNYAKKVLATAEEFTLSVY